MRLTSSAFADGAMIPRRFTCDGQDLSPPLAWADVPNNVRSFVLLCDDPDAPGGTWHHWAVYDIPRDRAMLPEGVALSDDDFKQATNDFSRVGYGGPCPPPGNPHRYFFKLYALDAKLNLKAGVTKPDVERAMKGHTLAHAELIGRYGR